MSKKVDRVMIQWTAWSETKPYQHDFSRRLTYRQVQKYFRLQEEVSLTAACAYAIKVGK